ncbi:NucA/NucB deoxyribonuclease domain-containing protein [Streptomyces flavofungini]|uniref:NucA/NucB deoxyribonuclease domain-containing protein n=1 Tax=Streptomyces flavofungini TaxID=68200 RepID=UPI0025B0ADFB|nr:NucA/NucB deoxyribonuclease domain-containing protein [Streptomyces flavofungini]WJV51761.1 NucA/NucB deoxyribonuclease domain-containing protein [Streptomyces flavofungini]
MTAAHAAPVSDQSSLQVSVGAVRQQAASTERAAAAVPCERGKAIYNRFESCTVVSAKVNVLKNGRPVGSATFDITHKMTLKRKSLKWSESVKVGTARLVGNARGVKVGLSVKCGGKCKATNRFPRGRSLGASISGKVAYQDKVAKLKKDSTSSKYTYTFTKAGYTPGGFNYRTVPYRCDDTFWSGSALLMKAGCVFHTYIPVMTTMSTLPDIARNIRTVQAGGGHYGRIGSGKPLHREADKVIAKKNRDKVCPPGQTPPRPGLSCDEYPFASTREGGHNVSADSRGTAWVPEDQQDAQGGRIQGFHKQARVLNRDAYWVKV